MAKRLPPRPWTSKELKRLEELEKHLPHTTIAKLLNRSWYSVREASRRLRKRKKSRGEKPSRHSQLPLPQRCPEAERIVRELNAQGLNDCEIARHFREERGIPISDSGINGWRRKWGLPCHKHSEGVRRKLRRASKENACVTGYSWIAVQNKLKAEAMGWPGCSLPEAKVLTLLFQEPHDGISLALKLGVSWSSKRTSYLNKVLGSLVKRGLVCSERRWIEATRYPDVYSVCPGVEPGPLNEPDDE